MTIRVAVLLDDRCQPKRCNKECISYCPRVRAGVVETILLGGRGKPVISEELCIGCGICVHKCPFHAIKILGLADELESDLIHQFEENGFRLFRLPTPIKGKVVGLLGSNGIGKTTILNILSGQIVPNLGDYDGKSSWDKVLEYTAGTELNNHFTDVESGEMRVAYKPQYVDRLPAHHKGPVMDLLTKVDDNDQIDEMIEMFMLEKVIDRDIRKLSGGELQRTAIAATMLKDADFYFFDEPSSYLDIFQRMSVSRSIQTLAEERTVMVVEHDLAILDFISDIVYILYGEAAAYGVVGHPRAVRSAINTYLEGYLREENIRFRDRAIKFEVHPPRVEWETMPLISFEHLSKILGEFSLETGKGDVHEGEVVGVLGPNATGKTTFVKMLAGELAPDEGEIASSISVSYKPQYIDNESQQTVLEWGFSALGDRIKDPFYRNEIEKDLQVTQLYDRMVTTLSGGELQRVALAYCLGVKADLYLLDEPSAYLDSNQRMIAAKTIRKVMEKTGKSAMVVDHDVYFIDLIADSIMVFSGIPARKGRGDGPYPLRLGMNMFLKQLDITFRRDHETKRPRINKPESRLDREQKGKGEFYYGDL